MQTYRTDARLRPDRLSRVRVLQPTVYHLLPPDYAGSDHGKGSPDSTHTTVKDKRGRERVRLLDDAKVCI